MSIFETNRQKLINALVNPMHIDPLMENFRSSDWADGYNWHMDTAIKIMENRGEIKVDRKTKVVTLLDSHKMWNR